MLGFAWNTHARGPDGSMTVTGGGGSGPVSSTRPRSQAVRRASPAGSRTSSLGSRRPRRTRHSPAASTVSRSLRRLVIGQTLEPTVGAPLPDRGSLWILEVGEHRRIGGAGRREQLAVLEQLSKRCPALLVGPVPQSPGPVVEVRQVSQQRVGDLAAEPGREAVAPRFAVL